MAKRKQDGAAVAEAVSAENDARMISIKADIASAAQRVTRLKEERGEINEVIAEIRAHVVTLGVPKAAFDMAMKYASFDEDKRKGFDLAYSIAREALGLPVSAQGDLFVDVAALGKQAQTDWEAAAPAGSA
jgi:uncharacterized protein (UPF0335 family)